MYKDFLDRVCHSYDFLALDAMGVLFTQTDEVEQVLQEHLFACECEYDESRLILQYLSATSGDLSEPELCQTLGLTKTQASSLPQRYTLMPQLIDLLEEAQNNYIGLSCMSNGIASWLKAAGRHNHLDTYIENWIISSDIGIRKPATSFFAKAAEQLGAAPQRILLVDNRPANLDAAHQLGFGTLWLSATANTDVAHPRLGSLEDLTDAIRSTAPLAVSA
ncbi:HAD family hydrolase [Polycladidibacter hongkongensis]|uniref:HAD family hydrolase n=1 Tax=Polycladidibacter hongkongensis TaxID=1647556 RepID=UPI00082CEC1E|nr:HAD family hydrolase [Pseudovibrio hongkongensis]